MAKRKGTEKVIITEPSLANAAQYLVMTHPLSLPQYFSIPFSFFPVTVFKHLRRVQKTKPVNETLWYYTAPLQYFYAPLLKMISPISLPCP